MIELNPIRRFKRTAFTRLSRDGRVRARAFIALAGRLSRQEIMKGVRKFEEEAKYTNFV